MGAIKKNKKRIGQSKKFGLQNNDPIKRTSEINRMNRVITSNYPKYKGFEYGLSDW